MTSQFWHSVSKRVEIHLPRLIKGAIFSLVCVVSLFALAYKISEYNGLLFFCLLLSMVCLFWCFGLLLVNRLYRVLPDKNEHGGLLYYWNLIVGWYGAIFLVFWFAGLLFMTFVAPVIMVFSIVS